ncbi:acetyl esterase/lipase [Neobacillus niacini]|uniref:alpha/beta hydrolase n=1 Tax=Neobacillus driksii TaxID=3035913 RepID=UPI0027811228|nr:alpha/beta hydrolase [Neobacillus niacini]MDQ0973152.1 acetyl esterase/lipase [Neobacillus niacini]
MKKTVIYKEDVNFSIKADFYGTNHENAPVIIYIHGGGLIWGTREEISEEMIKLYTNNGFSLFSIDYRLAPSTKLPEILEDIEDAIPWIQIEGPKQFSIDPTKIAVVGSSAGGFLALTAGTFTHKPRAIVSFYGYGDLVGSWATSPSKYYCQKDIVSKELAYKLITDKILTEASVEERFLFYVYARQNGAWIEEITGVNLSNNKEALYQFCPNRNVTNEFPPTLLLHGTKDSDVPYEQSVFMRGALIKQSVEARLITIPNGEHVFDKNFEDPIVQHALQQVIDFLKTHLN